MSPEQWNRVLDLFHAACERTGGERLELLEAVSRSDPSLRLIVEQMLRDHEAECSFLNESPAKLLPPGALSAAAPAAGQKIGHYELIGLIGRGGMGEVWAARDLELDRDVAIKFLVFGSAFGGAVQHLRREAKTVSALNHPNIVTVHEVIRSESGIAIVMELVEGKPLRQLCGKQLPVWQLADIGRQIARALAAAHARGIVHRDIKPENIILRPDGCVKVLDFGLARQTSGATSHSTFSLGAGTLRYMSPEQARGEPASSASDIFSFGLVLHELATGKHAFAGDSPLETAYAIVSCEPEAIATGGVPASLQRLILSMLSKSAAARPGAEQVISELDEIANKFERGPAGASRSKRTPARWRLWLAILAASITTIAVGIVWFGKARRDGQQLADLTIRPLTSQAGWESAPALSPDGDRVAFTWSPRLDAPKQIYIMRMIDAEPVKLAGSPPGVIGYLAWSPDGKRIAFKRQFDKQGALYSIGSSGGGEQKILDVNNGNISSGIDWSPDGNQIAFSDSPPGDRDHLAVYIYNLRTGEKHKLTSPPASIWGDWNPKFSPDGRTIAFKRVTGFWADDLYLVPVIGGRPQRITFMHRGIWGHAWMPDGKSLLVSCQRSSSIFGIWRFPLKSPSSPERVAQGGVDAITPATGLRTQRIAWVNQLWDLNIYRIPSSGAGKPERVIASTQRDQDAVYSPDGRIAWISDRSGAREIWMSWQDGSNQVQVTNFNGPQIDHLRWSFDGRHLAFDSRPSGYSDIFVLECPPGGLRCGAPKALNVVPAESPGWSADSKSVYFSSNRSGGWQIWKQDLSGGKPQQIAEAAGSCPNESPDGKWLYFSDRHDDSTIFRVPGSQSGTAGVGAQAVLGRPWKVQSEGWAVTAGEIIFIDRPTLDRPAAIRAYNIRTGKVRSVLDLSEVFLDRGDIGVSVSADGKSILYAQLDRSGSNVIIARKE